MSRVLVLFLIVIGLVFSACEATPPVVGPNESELPPVTIAVSPPEIVIPAPLDSTTAGNTPAETDQEGSVGFQAPDPDATVSISAGAFEPESTVEIGIELSTGFSGNPPKVGPLTPESTDDIAVTSTSTAASNGSLQFGVYSITTTTTPGTYTLFAEQEDVSYTITLTLLPPEDDTF